MSGNLSLKFWTAEIKQLICLCANSYNLAVSFESYEIS